MITKHPLDPQDAITMAKLRSVVASTKGSVSGPSAREPLTLQMGFCVNGRESRYPCRPSGG